MYSFGIGAIHIKISIKISGRLDLSPQDVQSLIAGKRMVRKIKTGKTLNIQVIFEHLL